MSQTLATCLEANPDIAGVGVRFAIYFQAFVTIIPLALSVLDGKIEGRERKVLRTVFFNLLLTSSALLLTAFVRHGPAALSKYHIFIILELCWINITTSLGHIGAQFLAMQEYRGKLSSYISSGKDWLTIGFSCVHMSLTAALGLWTWAVSHPDQFNCPQTYYSILGQPIQATTRALRIASLTVYSLIAFPGFNLIIALFVLLIPFSFLFLKGLLLLVFLFEGVARALHVPIRWRSDTQFCDSSISRSIQAAKAFTKRPSTIAFTSVLFVLTCQIILVIDIEKMVKRNHGIVGKAEDQWTFGQTLAIVLLVLPIVETFKQCRDWYKETRQQRNVSGQANVETGDRSEEHLAPSVDRRDEESHGVEEKEQSQGKTTMNKNKI